MGKDTRAEVEETPKGRGTYLCYVSNCLSYDGLNLEQFPHVLFLNRLLFFHQM